jgi:hypothetical protein
LKKAITIFKKQEIYDFPSLQTRRPAMKKTLMTVLLLTLIVSGSFAAPKMTSAAETPGAAPQLNVDIPLTDNLTALKGKTVTVTMSSGQSISGVVKDVKNGLLHLEKLSQKDFFDAVIMVDKISAVEVRVRQ